MHTWSFQGNDYQIVRNQSENSSAKYDSFSQFEAVFGHGCRMAALPAVPRIWRLVLALQFALRLELVRAQILGWKNNSDSASGYYSLSQVVPDEQELKILICKPLGWMSRCHCWCIPFQLVGTRDSFVSSQNFMQPLNQLGFGNEIESNWLCMPLE